MVNIQKFYVSLPKGISYVCWLINPLTIDISSINPRFCGVIKTLDRVNKQNNHMTFPYKLQEQPHPTFPD